MRSSRKSTPHLAVWVVTTALFVVGLTSLEPVGAQTPAVAASASVAGTYMALTPSRITDTRTGSGYPNAGSTLGAGSSLNVQVSGVGNVPASGVTAVVMNVTAVGPTAASYVTVFPEGTAQPLVSNLNFTAGETLANLATVPVGSQGGVTFYNHAGTVNLVVDVEGYYTTTPQAGGLYDPVTPLRVLGSLATGAPIGPGALTGVTVAGVDGVPADASAVVANVTAAASNSPGFLTVFPSPKSGAPTPPTASNLNFTTGQVIANRITIPVGSNGQIEVYNESGTVNVDIDLDGYYTGSSGELGSGFTPMSPVRVTDTRVALNGSVLGGNNTESFSFSSEGLSHSATALVANVTVVSGQSAGYLTVYPTTASSPPGVSDTNFAANSIAQNFTLAPLNGAATDLFNSSPVPVNIVIDAFGFFAPPPPAVAVAAGTTSLPANGESQTVITVTVTTGSGVAFDDSVTLTTTPSIAGSCGTVSGTGSTNASGQVMSTYTSSTTAGTCTVTATEANNEASGSIVITQTPTS
jgi:hypothetical protein